MADPILSETGNNAGCKQCGAILQFAPGTNALKCKYCGFLNEIATDHAPIEELDFHSHLNADLKNGVETVEVPTVKCTSCGAESSLKPNVTSDDCPFCGTALVLKQKHITTAIKPRSVLPFKVDKNKAYEAFTSWLKSLWFAPNDLKKYAATDKLNGMYIPYWTYDTDTTTGYRGERGVDRTEYRTVTRVENGQSVTRQESYTVTDWYPASGTVYNKFDDVLVNASNSLPRNIVEKLEPWDLPELKPFNENYLAGFRTESYQIGLKEGFEHAKNKMEPVIETSIRRDIGGDHQRIHSSNSQYDDITFKHTLLPLWISSYRYNNKSFRFLVNARSGETSGERPYSYVKIFFAVITGLLTLFLWSTGSWIIILVTLLIYLLLLFKVFK